MGKIYCLYNNKNQDSIINVQHALLYHDSWQNRAYKDDHIFLGIFELPFKDENVFWYEDGNLVIAMDGEILSWRVEVDASTTMDRIAFLFYKFGSSLVKYLNGNFNIVIWSKKEKKLNILNDRLGIRPLYYARIKEKVIFCSEIKGIIADPDFKKDLDLQGVIDFFTYEYILDNKTFFNDINVFPYASVMEISNENISLMSKRYYDFIFSENGLYCGEDKYLDQFKEITLQAVQRCMRGNSKVALFLSGGLDSRMIAAAIDRKYYPLDSFTFGEKGCDDVRIAAKLSKKLKAVHHIQDIKHARLIDIMQKGVFYCDGLAVGHHYLILNCLEEAKEYADVSLDGFLGDVLPRLMYKNLHGHNGEAVYSKFDVFKEDLRIKIFSQDVYNEIGLAKKRFLSLWNDISGNSNPVDYLNLTQRQRRFITFGKVIIRNYLEVRLPYADNDFIDFCLKMPIVFRKDDAISKKLFVKYFPKLASVPQQGTGLPLNANSFQKAIKWRKDVIKKRIGILPDRTYNCDRWYRGPLKDFVCSLLLSQKFKSRKMFNYKEVENLLNGHFQGKYNYENRISTLLMFEIWSRMFFDSDTTIQPFQHIP